jgi:hypothetical protein
MLSARDSCRDRFREAGGLEMLVHLLETADLTLLLERGAIILANLAESALNRYHLRLEVNPLLLPPACPSPIIQ